MINRPVGLAGKGVVWLWQVAKRPQGDRQQVPRPGRARRRPGFQPSAPPTAISPLHSHRLPPESLIPGECSPTAPLFLHRHRQGPGIAPCSIFCPLYPSPVHRQPRILQLTPLVDFPALRGGSQSLVCRPPHLWDGGCSPSNPHSCYDEGLGERRFCRLSAAVVRKQGSVVTQVWEPLG